MKEKYDLSLDNRQIVSLLIGALVVLGSVFVLGVVVGKNLSGEPGASEAPDLLTALDAKARQRDADEDAAPLTFPDILTERRSVTPPRTEPMAVPAPAGDKAAAQKLADSKKLAEQKASEQQKLAEQKASEQKASEQKLAEQKLADDKAAAEQKLLAEQKAAQDKAAAEQKLLAEKKAAAEKAALAAASTPAAATPTRTAPNARLDDAFERAASPSGTAGQGAFTLQLSASQNESEAEAFAQRLRSRGYAPYIVTGEVEGRGTFYRVRMGSFPSREAAQSYLSDFKRETKLDGFIAAN